MVEHSWNKTHRLGNAWQMKQKLGNFIRANKVADGSSFWPGNDDGRVHCDSDTAILVCCRGPLRIFLLLRIFLPHATFFN